MSVPATGHVAVSGLSYTVDDVEAFVQYVYAEYWADDLAKDEFVPTTCIEGHFDEGIVWTFGGKTTHKGLTLAGRYGGHAGMSQFLSAFGKTFKVVKWEAANVTLTGGPDEFTAYVDLEAEYIIRSSGRRLHLDEVHILQIKRRVSDREPQISSVTILLDQLALLQVLEAPTKPANKQPKLSKAQRMLGAEAPAAIPVPRLQTWRRIRALWKPAVLATVAGVLAVRLLRPRA